ncbi:MAG: hypothetical protein ACO3ZY_13580 [Phycisphaerales bacterium]
MYRDAEGRDWRLVVTVSTLERCRSQAEYDPMRLVHEGEMHRLMLDPVLLASLAWCCVEDEARTRGVDRRAFVDAARGDALDRLFDAFLSEFASFFPSTKATMVSKAGREVAAAYSRAMSAPDDSGAASTSWPASPASTLAA